MKVSKPEFDHSDIHFRDKWQFELKSEFFPHPALKENIYTQELFMFIPNALQINRQNYTKDNFYQDQTNLIRYKTPVFTFTELLAPEHSASPLHKIEKIRCELSTLENKEIIEEELKLLGNIVRSALRTKVDALLILFKEGKKSYDEIKQFSEEIGQLKERFRELKLHFQQHWENRTIDCHFQYVEEFISKNIHNYFIYLREKIPDDTSKKIYSLIDKTIFREIEEREQKNQEPIPNSESLHNEYILYRRGLLNKFVHRALLLHTNRYSPTSKYRNLIGAVSAGIAMLFFLTLFIRKSGVVATNSAPFVIISVILYILKDRIKEGLRNISYKQAFRWFPDFAIQILSPGKETILGVLKESFSFLSEDKIPEEILSARNRDFHFVLEDFKRPEQVMYHKKTVAITPTPISEKTRRNGLNVIFRFNIHQFLTKASNPYYSYHTLDKPTGGIINIGLPKVYHLNIIVRNTFQINDLKKKTELKKYRIIIDKTGIKRIERLGG